MEFITGIRTKTPGGNRYFADIEEAGFDYDSSLRVPQHKIPIFPYTLTTKIPHPCHEENDARCPSKSVEIIWEFPLNSLLDTESKNGCRNLLDCHIDSPVKLYEILSYNFVRHYHTNRAPFVVPLTRKIFETVPRISLAILRFLSDVHAHYENVHFVTLSDALAWVRTPKLKDSAKVVAKWHKRGTCHRLLHSLDYSVNCVAKECKFFQNDGTSFKVNSCTSKCPRETLFIA